MLDNRHRELLAAYVDGELSARQRKAMLRLLQQSAEARELLRRMQQDAEALRRLPRPRLERDLSTPVVHLIVERRLHPPSRRRHAKGRRPNFAAWAGFSAAAAALLLVVLGSYLYFSWSLQEGPDRNLASNGKPERPERELAPAPALAADVNSQPAVAVRPPEPERVSPPAVAAAEPPPVPAPDAAIVAAPDPVAGMEMFQVAPVTQLQIVKVAELDHAPRRQQLLKDLAKEPAYRMEAPVKDSIKALEQLKIALTARGIGLAIDQTAQVRMTALARRAKIKTNF